MRELLPALSEERQTRELVSVSDMNSAAKINKKLTGHLERSSSPSGLLPPKQHSQGSEPLLILSAEPATHCMPRHYYCAPRAVL